ncbi:MAG: nitroreductase family protein, partial [Actinomycetota bacterium]
VHVILCVSEGAYHRRYQEADKLDPDGKEMEWPIPYWWIDGGAAMMLLLMAAVNEGLAAGFFGTHALEGLRSLLQIPEDHTPFGIVTIGRSAPDRRSGSLKRGWKPSGTVIRRESWSG